MDVGIVGAPGTGRSTVFDALMAHRAGVAESKSAAAIGAIHVADPRLDALSERFKPRKTTPIEIRVHDLCASLEPSFPTAELEAMKRVDVLLLVVPAFADPEPSAAVAALSRLITDLCLEDLTAVERRLERAAKEGMEPALRAALEAAKAALESERPLQNADLPGPQRAALRGYGLITDRPLIAVLNVAEDAAGAPPPAALAEHAGALGLPLLALCAALEREMAGLPQEDRGALLAEYGVAEPAGAAVTRAILEVADLIPFFTVGEDECRAWAIPRGTVARSAAGKIHSDLERGFIRAEVIGYDAFAPLGDGLAEARKRGLLRLEGKDYVVADGDIVHFRFNV